MTYNYVVYDVIIKKVWNVNFAFISKHGSSGTKPAKKFLVSIPFLTIELKDAPNGNSTNDFYWK